MNPQQITYSLWLLNIIIFGVGIMSYTFLIFVGFVMLGFIVGIIGVKHDGKLASLNFSSEK